VNPFAAMSLASSNREMPTATVAELQTFRKKATEPGLSSLATAALIGWEWLQREVDIFATFEVTHYRHKSPKVLGKYVKKTMKQVAADTRKRVAARTEGGQLSEMSKGPLVRMA
jgi:hypothetical protein